MRIKRYSGHGAALAVSVYLLTICTGAAAEVYYETDFESRVLSAGTATPVWSLRPATAATHGAGNFFEVVEGNAHSGQYSLRFNYEGRNGICNTCGETTRRQKTPSSGVNYFLDSISADLTQSPIFAATDRLVYNKSDGWSKWRIVSVDSQEAANDKLSLIKLQGGIGTAKNSFNSDDVVGIFRQCDVDGTIGGNIKRRSDCDVAINYFDGISQSLGESVFRRVYLMIDPKTTVPYNQKLRYWNSTNGPVYLVVRKNPGYDRIFPYVEGLNTLGGPSYIDTGISMIPGVWYYVEEEFKAQTSAGVADGEYRLWFATAGEETDTPVIEQSGLNLGVVKSASLWGNHQHFTDSSGYWYIDDLKISNVRVGPMAASGENIAPPESPQSVRVR